MTHPTPSRTAEFGPYRNGKIHVQARMCDTCIFRPGNLMHLDEGRLEAMVAGATKNESCIDCHDTLDGFRSVCRGFYEKHPTTPLRLAAAMRIVEFTGS